MKIRFTAGGYLQEYHGNGLALKDGQVEEVPAELGEKLTKDFPDHFAEVDDGEGAGDQEPGGTDREPGEKAPGGPEKDKMVTGGKKK